MTPAEYRRRFDKTLTAATDAASEFAGRSFRRPVDARLMVPDFSERLIPIDEAVDHLYLGVDESYVFVDVAFVADGPDVGTAWIRPSAHAPGPYSATWDPEGSGPFRNVGAVVPGNSPLAHKSPGASRDIR